MQARVNFLPAREVRWAKILPYKPKFILNRKVSGAQKKGLSYEKKALAMLERKIQEKPNGAELQLLKGPWIEFEDASGRRWCQPDAIILGNLFHAVIVEIKYKHTPSAWYQLWELYLPVLKCIFEEYNFACLELVSWHDPLVKFPEDYKLTDSPFRIPDKRRTAVHIWNPNRD
jgi:hypothetical protein